MYHNNLQRKLITSRDIITPALKCQVSPEKTKIDLAKKVCLVLGISNESASISDGIAKTLSEAGAKVYTAPSQNNNSAKKWPEITQPYRNNNVIPIKGFYFMYIFNGFKHIVFCALIV